MDRIQTVDFGRANAGAGSIGYRLINSGGSVTTARTQAGITEIGSGAFMASVTFPADWSGIILWDNGRATRTYAHRTFNPDDTAKYVGSTIWNMNPNNFIAPDTFGQRMEKILQRASGGGGVVAAAASVFNVKEKEKLFEWIEMMFKRFARIEEVMSDIIKQHPEVVKVIAEIKVSNSDLKDSIKRFSEIDTQNSSLLSGETKIIKEDLQSVLRSFNNLLRMKESLSNITTKLVLMEGVLSNFDKISLNAIDGIVRNRNTEVKTLIGQSINIANDVKSKITGSVELIEKLMKDNEITDAILIKMAPEEVLNEVISELKES